MALLSTSVLRNFSNKFKIRTIDYYILGFCVLNIVQALLTPILRDEAYYWMYSKNLDFGYFDHPPMVAYIIKLSSYLFANSILGVRFITIILLAITSYIIWSLIPKQQKEYRYAELMFFTIMFSMPIFNIFSFVTTPDVPLLFSSALFLLSLNLLLKKENLFSILNFGISCALLIYSKYHGGIIILLALVFNVKLFKKKGIYMAGLIALVLIIPHLYWQYKNDFITFNYHLFERTSGQFEIQNITHYTLSTLGILNPALLIVFFIDPKKNGMIWQKNRFYLQMFIGFLSFFFIYSFRSRVEAHWVSFAILPMILLIYNLAISNNRIRKYLRYTVVTSIILILLLRIAMMLDLPLKTEIHQKRKDYFQEISRLANGARVVFLNSYHKASKYAFYTGEVSFSDNDVFHRKNQYDLWNSELMFSKSRVLLIENGYTSLYDTLIVNADEIIIYQMVDSYPILNRLKVLSDNEQFSELNKRDNKKITINNPYDYRIDLNNCDLPYKFYFYLYQANKQCFVPLKVQNIEQLEANINNDLTISWVLDEAIPSGLYQMQIVLQVGQFNHKSISKQYQVLIK